jgi:hypothetical protein
LDKKIAREGFDKVFQEDIFKNTNQRNNIKFPDFGGFQSFGQSSTFRRIQRPDGVYIKLHL